ncbi:MAG: hypothetical protein O9972_48000 [Burkholderiales bacterium]|nr:hypothetical protein [Burkholderiales bacterium]
MKFIGVVGVVALCFAISLQYAFAQSNPRWTDLYVCGASKGQSLYLGEHGWQADGISKGVVIARKSGNDFDLFIGDGVAGFTALQDGAEVIGRFFRDGSLQILAYYPLTIETYLFSCPVSGRVKLAWTQSKSSATGAKAALFESSCFVKR